MSSIGSMGTASSSVPLLFVMVLIVIILGRVVVAISRRHAE